ncbi:hypothetical protein EVJ58_g7962 [Rhodofomes roseus]|uniref:RRM domain-containing protein n=1 Tax=Rhodofomes roseus TaxID=34475 RepID=A0A4Y9Y0M8_9APHY|nr:hypothetical protein EVJ58_g7962 [Rhodofomes roseus]
MAKAGAKAAPPTKPTPVKANGKAKKAPSSDSSSSESEDEKPKATQVKATPKKASSSSDSEGESSSEDEASKKTAALAKAASSPEESDSDSSEEEAPKKATATLPKKATPAKTAPAKAASSSSSSEESSDDEASKKPQQKATTAKTTPAKKEASDEDSSDESSEDEDVVMADETTKNGKRKANDEAPAPAKKAKLATNDATATDGSEPTKAIFVGRLSWNVDNDWLAQEFAECGEVVSARVQMDRNTGKSRGFGYVNFATEEAVEAALKLNGKEIDGRPVNVDKSVPKAPTERRESRAQAFGDSQSSPSATLFVGNLSWDATEDILWETFSEYGEVKSVRMPTDRETGKPKGFGYVEFSDVDLAKKAFEGAAGAEIAGREIRLDYSQPRDSNGGGGRGFGGGDRGGRGRGFGGGDRGGRGRGRGFGGGFGGDRGGGRGGGRGRGGDRGRGGGRGGRGGPRTGAIAQSAGTKVTFD